MSDVSSCPRDRGHLQPIIAGRSWKRLCTLLFFVPLLLSAQPRESFFFVQLADPQFGMYRIGRDFKHEREHVAKAVRAINRLRPDFVVICGDLVNKAGNEKQIKAFKESFAALDSTIPLYLVAGNHDVGNTPTIKSLQAYRRTFGQDYYSFEHRGVRFIVLNSSLLKGPGSARTEAKEQDEWFQSLLQPHHTPRDNGRTSLLLHHPFFVKNAEESDKYQNIPSKTRMAYLHLLDETGVKNVFAGHLHHNAGGVYKGVEVTASGPVGLPLGTDPSGLRIVEVGPNGLRHRYYSLDDVPDSLEGWK